MKTIQMTIDDHLLKRVDTLVRSRKTSRSAFIREAIEAEIRRDQVHELERQHAEGYAKNPIKPGEFDIWLKEQAWGVR